jgi:hypothetical protein
MRSQLFKTEETGKELKPRAKTIPQEQIDPITTLTRTVACIINIF